MSYSNIYHNNLKTYMGARNDRDAMLMLECHKDEYLARAALFCHIKSLAQWAWRGFK